MNGLAEAEAVDAHEVEAAVRAVSDAEGIPAGEISVTFVDRAEMARMNRTYLERGGATDVIAFDLGTEVSPLGDVYICPAVARESSAELDVDLREELLRLVVHGVLHVLGYTHPDGPERATSEMFRRQEEILGRVL